MPQLARLARHLAIAIFAATLAACANKAAVTSSEPFHIATIDMVGGPPAGGTVNQLEDLRAKAMVEASRMPKTANPKALKLQIVRYHVKNPGKSLILGDSNQLEVAGEVIEPTNGAVIGRFKSTVVDDYAVNGVIGAMLAAADDPVQVEQRLNSKAASGILEQIYGSKTWRRTQRAPATAAFRPNYPRSYALVSACEQDRRRQLRAARRTGTAISLPAQCGAGG